MMIVEDFWIIFSNIFLNPQCDDGRFLKELKNKNIKSKKSLI